MIIKVSKQNYGTIELNVGNVKVINPLATSNNLRGDSYQFISTGDNILQKLSSQLEIGVNTFSTNIENLTLEVKKTAVQRSTAGMINGTPNTVTSFVYDGYYYEITLIKNSNRISYQYAWDDTVVGGGQSILPKNERSNLVLNASKICLMSYVYNNNGIYETYIGLVCPYYQNILLPLWGTGNSQQTAQGNLKGYTYRCTNEMFEEENEYLFNNGGQYVYRNNANNAKIYYPDKALNWYGSFQNYSFYNANGTGLLKIISSNEPPSDTDDNAPDDG